MSPPPRSPTGLQGEHRPIRFRDPRSRRRRRALRRSLPPQDRRAPGYGPRHAPMTRLVRRRPVQSRNGSSTSAGSLDETNTGSMSSMRNVSESSCLRASFAARRACASFLRRRTGTTRPERGSRRDTTMPLTSGKPCSHVGSWMTTGTRSQRCSSAVSHTLVGRQRQEVGEDEDERPGRHRARVRRQVLERALQPVGRACVLRRPEPWVAELDHLPLPLRLPPVRIAVRVVQVADEAAGDACAGENQLHDVTHGKRLVEPGQRGGEVRHLRPSVADDHDLRRLFREALPDDELVASLRGRESRRCRPVDRVHVVARPVRTRPRDIGAGAAA